MERSYFITVALVFSSISPFRYFVISPFRHFAISCFKHAPFVLFVIGVNITIGIKRFAREPVSEIRLITLTVICFQPVRLKKFLRK